jgi:hypothetical protein
MAIRYHSPLEERKLNGGWNARNRQLRFPTKSKLKLSALKRTHSWIYWIPTTTDRANEVIVILQW